jgi:hypothetical protein
VGSSGQCNKKKIFFKKISKHPKVIAGGVVKSREERESVQKIVSENPKVPAAVAVKEQEDAVLGLKNIFERP